MNIPVIDFKTILIKNVIDIKNETFLGKYWLILWRRDQSKTDGTDIHYSCAYVSFIWPQDLFRCYKTIYKVQWK